MQVVLDEGDAAVGGSIDGASPGLIAGAGGPAILHVLFGIEVIPPVIDYGTVDEGGGIGCLDGFRGSDFVDCDFVIRGSDGVDVAMFRVPPGGFVVEVIGVDAAVGRGAEFTDEIGDPGAGPGWRIDRGAGCSGQAGGDCNGAS